MCREVFVSRHISVLRALLAHGLADAAARELITRTRRLSGKDYHVAQDGSRYLVRERKGYHADVFRLEPAGG